MKKRLEQLEQVAARSREAADRRRIAAWAESLPHEELIRLTDELEAGPRSPRIAAMSPWELHRAYQRLLGNG